MEKGWLLKYGVSPGINRKNKSINYSLLALKCYLSDRKSLMGGRKLHIRVTEVSTLEMSF